MHPEFRVRRALASDAAAFASICLKTGRYGDDGTNDFPNDPDALARIYTSPYLALQLDLALALEDKSTGQVVGYCLAAADSAHFYSRYDSEIRPALASAFPGAPDERPWTDREREIHELYRCPDYSVPEPRERFPSHLHIDLLPTARRRGYGRQLVRLQLAQLASTGSPGVHLGLAASNTSALAFYAELGFVELSRDASTVMMGRELLLLPRPGPPPVPGDCNVASYLAGPGAALACGAAVFGPAWVAVTQPDPWAVAEAWLGGSPPLAVLLAASVHERALEGLLARVPPAARVIVGIGGGLACDAAKYIAWRSGLRFVCVPTALTVDAFVTPPAGVRYDVPGGAAAASEPEGGAGEAAPSTLVRYVGHATPDPLVVDWDLLRTAPPHLNVAGVGDLLSIHTACWDWERAIAAGRSEFPPAPADIAAARTILADTLAAAPEIARCSDAGLRALVEGYMRVNALCLPAGHARVEEGSEHFLFYALEARLGRGFIHGHIVGLGVHILARLQGNDPDGVTASMRAMGLRFQPAAMGISRADLRGALLELRAFVDGRPDLWYSVINEAPITEAWVDGVLAELEFEVTVA